MSLWDQIDGSDAASDSLSELRLRKEPAMVVAFTSDPEEARLHYEEDPAVRGYVLCPGDRCPLCYLGAEPTLCYLLPVFDLERREIAVLRISSARGPGALFTALAPQLRGDLASKLLLISKVDQFKHRVEAKPLGPNVDRGADAVRAFIACENTRNRVLSAVKHLTAAELADVARIRNKLDAIGGYSAE